jgi:hypothetical protein
VAPTVRARVSEQPLSWEPCHHVRLDLHKLRSNRKCRLGPPGSTHAPFEARGLPALGFRLPSPSPLLTSNSRYCILSSNDRYYGSWQNSSRYGKWRGRLASPGALLMSTSITPSHPNRATGVRCLCARGAPRRSQRRCHGGRPLQLGSSDRVGASKPHFPQRCSRTRNYDSRLRKCRSAMAQRSGRLDQRANKSVRA